MKFIFHLRKSIRYVIYVTSFIIISISIMPASAQVYPNHVVGNVGNISSTADGLLIMMEGGIQPENCNHQYGWMIISSSSQVMASVALSYFLSGKKLAAVYAQSQPGSSMCLISQFDPY